MIGKPRKYCAPRSIGYPLQVLDVGVDAYAAGSYRHRNLGPPNTDSPRILLMNSGHLGDALTMTYLLPFIRARYPAAVIDVLAGDWCAPILRDNPYIRRVITLNHANTNRRNIGKWAKWQDHIRTMRAAITTLRTEVYDYSIDVRFSDSPMHFILPFIRVRRAIGFGTRGFGGLLNDEFFLPDGEFHHLNQLLRLLEPMDVRATLREITPYFPVNDAARGALLEKLNGPGNGPSLILVCPESGEPTRFLPPDFWLRLTEKLLAETSAQVVFCGQKPETSGLAIQLTQQHPDRQNRLIDTVGKLTLTELAALAERAEQAYTVESLPAHLCSVFCPTVSFFRNGTGLQFFPLGNQAVTIFHNHPYSENLTLDRAGFSAIFVTDFDGTVIQEATKPLTNS